MAKQTIRDVELAAKRVLVRVDYNVPFEPSTVHIADDSRIQATIPTLRYLHHHGAAIILCSHLGRPQGRVVEKLRMKPIVTRLASLLDHPVSYVEECTGPQVEEAVAALRPGGILLLENLRFHPEEEQNDPTFARALASLADVFVNDAFGAAHRAHASTEGVARFLPAVAGLLMERELHMLGQALHDSPKPLMAILGGAKVNDKIGVLESFLDKVDALLIGGGMAATFLKAQGYAVGSSQVEVDRLDYVSGLFHRANHQETRLVTPTDVVAAEAFAPDATYQEVPVSQVPEGWFIMDIGHETLASFRRELQAARTVVWNGPMGVFEFPPFAKGTRGVAQILAGLANATTIVGGGSTAEAVVELGLASAMSHVSTGGGASLRFLEGRQLPGVAALLDKDP